jgi:hypothetical protein
MAVKAVDSRAHRRYLQKTLNVGWAIAYIATDIILGRKDIKLIRFDPLSGLDPTRPIARISA